jgi:hypothetical protein
VLGEVELGLLPLELDGLLVLGPVVGPLLEDRGVLPEASGRGVQSPEREPPVDDVLDEVEPSGQGMLL